MFLKLSLIYFFALNQGPQGPQGVQGERGPLGEGLPGPKVSYVLFFCFLGGPLKTVNPLHPVFTSPTNRLTCSKVSSGLQIPGRHDRNLTTCTVTSDNNTTPTFHKFTYSGMALITPWNDPVRPSSPPERHENRETWN